MSLQTQNLSTLAWKGLVELEIGLGRKGKQVHNDSFDLEGRVFHQRVWQEYDKIYRENSDSQNIDPIFGLWILIDANQPLNSVRLELRQKTREYLVGRFYSLCVKIASCKMMSSN